MFQRPVIVPSAAVLHENAMTHSAFQFSPRRQVPENVRQSLRLMS